MDKIQGLVDQKQVLLLEPTNNQINGRGCSSKTSNFYIHSTVYLLQQLLSSDTTLLHVIRGFRRKITSSLRHCVALAKHSNTSKISCVHLEFKSCTVKIHNK